MAPPIRETDSYTVMGRNAFGVAQLARRPLDHVGRFMFLLFANDEPVDELLEPESMFIPEDLAGTFLISVEAFVHTPSAGTINLSLQNLTDSVDMLSTHVTIDSGEKCSKNAATPYEIDPDNAGPLDECTEIAIWINDDGGGDAEGLKVAVGFGKAQTDESGAGD